MAKYRKKPVVIDAIQWTGENLGQCKIFLGDSFAGALTEKRIGGKRDLLVQTLEGKVMASKGDYLIRGIQGEYYPCKPDIFSATYEAVAPPKPEEYTYKCSTCGRTMTSKTRLEFNEVYCHRLPMIEKIEK